jgi:hypothetical protein
VPSIATSGPLDPEKPPPRRPRKPPPIGLTLSENALVGSILSSATAF